MWVRLYTAHILFWIEHCWFVLLSLFDICSVHVPNTMVVVSIIPTSFCYDISRCVCAFVTSFYLCCISWFVNKCCKFLKALFVHVWDHNYHVGYDGSCTSVSSGNCDGG